MNIPCEARRNFQEVPPCPCLSGLQKGPAERGHVKKRQKSSESVKKFFDTFRAGQKTSKIVKKSFSTIFARHLFSGPFCNPLNVHELSNSDLAGELSERFRKYCSDLPTQPRKNKQSDKF